MPRRKISTTRMTFLIAFLVGITSLAGCSNSKCKMSGSPSSVTVSQNALGQCVLNSSISCTCSGGGALSSCSDGSQSLNQGSVAPGLFIPCPSTFSCSGLSSCST